MAAPSIAEHYRAHREEFELALELGITPRAAREEIRLRQARLRWLAKQQRLDSKMHQSFDFARDERLGSERSEPWMMRD